jgi:hypothetical protein
MNLSKATAVAASAWNRYESMNERSTIATPHSVLSLGKDEALRRMRWYLALPYGETMYHLYSKADVEAAIGVLS